MNYQILHKLQMLLRKEKFNKEIYNAHEIIMIVLKSITLINSERKSETFRLKSSVISINLKYDKVFRLKSDTKLISIVCSDEKRLNIIIKNMIIHVLKRAAAKAIENILLLKKAYREKSIESLIELVDSMFSDDYFIIDI